MHPKLVTVANPVTERPMIGCWGDVNLFVVNFSNGLIFIFNYTFIKNYTKILQFAYRRTRASSQSNVAVVKRPTSQSDGSRFSQYKNKKR